MDKAFIDVQLCESMGIDYWTLMEQPSKHTELYTMYLNIKNKVQEENNKRMNNKIKSPRKYGR